jgi:uncharacterized protein
MKLASRNWPVLALALLTSAFASGASAASFDCRRARQPDERAICRDPGLDDQDVRVAVLYEVSSHFLAMGARGALVEEQRRWIAARRRCGADRACLRRSYATRLKQLNGILERAYALGPL